MFVRVCSVCIVESGFLPLLNLLLVGEAFGFSKALKNAALLFIDSYSFPTKCDLPG